MQNISKKLGVDTEGQKLTKVLCLKKVAILKKGLERGKYGTGKLRKYAVYYKNWYAWRAKNARVVAKKKAKRSTKRKAA